MPQHFHDRLSFGQRGQDILINFLERHFGYKFEAGERSGSLLNTDFIEEIEHCEVIQNMAGMGTRLLFERGDEKYYLTMPEVLMSRNSSDHFYWIEAKRHSFDQMELLIDRDSFLDYKLLYLEFTRQEFYVMCLNPREGETTWDIYFCEFGKLLEENFEEKKTRGNTVYSWNINNVMEKLNKYPINIEKYK